MAADDSVDIRHARLFYFFLMSRKDSTALLDARSPLPGFEGKPAAGRPLLSRHYHQRYCRP